jgi:hypothetical protein
MEPVKNRIANKVSKQVGRIIGKINISLDSVAANRLKVSRRVGDISKELNGLAGERDMRIRKEEACFDNKVTSLVMKKIEAGRLFELGITAIEKEHSHVDWFMDWFVEHMPKEHFGAMAVKMLETDPEAFNTLANATYYYHFHHNMSHPVRYWNLAEAIHNISYSGNLLKADPAFLMPLKSNSWPLFFLLLAGAQKKDGAMAMLMRCKREIDNMVHIAKDADGYLYENLPREEYETGGRAPQKVHEFLLECGLIQ